MTCPALSKELFLPFSAAEGGIVSFGQTERKIDSFSRENIACKKQRENCPGVAAAVLSFSGVMRKRAEDRLGNVQFAVCNFRNSDVLSCMMF